MTYKKKSQRKIFRKNILDMPVIFNELSNVTKSSIFQKALELPNAIATHTPSRETKISLEN